MRVDFYRLVLTQAGIEPEDSVLAVCAGTYDKNSLQAIGVRRAVISNVDYHAGVSEYGPYDWQFQDAEKLSADDESFDWCVVHAGLHHCGSPHWALCEMLRVAKKGVVVVETRDSLLMRVAASLGFTSQYELAASALTEGKSGGYRNGNIPNYVYRWTEREVEKTIRTFLPSHEPSIRYFYQYLIPTEEMTMSRNPLKRAIATGTSFMTGLFEALLPKQGNRFGFVILKKARLHAWLTEHDGKLAVNMDYLRKIYAPEKYVQATGPEKKRNSK
jgi:ubiquinone/menaquinone biosynthesis C-methylase UbiE